VVRSLRPGVVQSTGPHQQRTQDAPVVRIRHQGVLVVVFVGVRDQVVYDLGQLFLEQRQPDPEVLGERVRRQGSVLLEGGLGHALAAARRPPVGVRVLDLLDSFRYQSRLFAVFGYFVEERRRRARLEEAEGSASQTFTQLRNRAKDRLRGDSPWDRQASTAAHSDVTEPLSSCTNFLVTDSSITCFTSFFTAVMRRPLNSFSTNVKNGQLC
jgi:hypothetical protein